MSHIQGNLQTVFDALYELGVIDPVLKMDWGRRLAEIEDGSPELNHAVTIVNHCGSDRNRLKVELGRLDRSALEVLAMEVAREYAEFHARQALH